MKKPNVNKQFELMVEEAIKTERLFKDAISEADRVLAECGKQEARPPVARHAARGVNRSHTIDQTIGSLPETSGVGRLSVRYPPSRGSRLMSTPRNATIK